MSGRTTTPTLHDVARVAGVSLATASRVLNGSTRKVAETYRHKVEAAAAQLNYIPNLSAQATAKGTSNLVALLVSDIADPYFGMIAQGIARDIDAAGLMMTIAMTQRDAQRELEIVRSLRGQRPRGLVLASSRNLREETGELYQELDAFTSRGGKVVMLGHPGSCQTARVVLPDNRGGATKLGAEMAELGYREAIVIGAHPDWYVSTQRAEGFIDGFTAAGGHAPRVLHQGFDWNAGYDAMRAELEWGVAPGTLVMGVTDVAAIGAMHAIRESGREPGRDVAVCGIDDIPTSRDMWPALTSVRLSLPELGRRALAAVLSEEWEQPEPIPAVVQLRASTPRRTAE